MREISDQRTHLYNISLISGRILQYISDQEMHQYISDQGTHQNISDQEMHQYISDQGTHQNILQNISDEGTHLYNISLGHLHTVERDVSNKYAVKPLIRNIVSGNTGIW